MLKKCCNVVFQIFSRLEVDAAVVETSGDTEIFQWEICLFISSKTVRPVFPFCIYIGFLSLSLLAVRLWRRLPISRPIEIHCSVRLNCTCDYLVFDWFRNLESHKKDITVKKIKFYCILLTLNSLAIINCLNSRFIHSSMVSPLKFVSEGSYKLNLLTQLKKYNCIPIFSKRETC